MTLAEASRAALAAAAAGDLDALAGALEARAQAIEAGESPTPGIVEDGERTFALLQAFLREVGYQSARLQRIAEGFGTGAPAPRLDYFG